MKRSRVIADAKQQQKKDVKEPLKRSKVTPSAQKIEDAPLVYVFFECKIPPTTAFSDLDGTVYDSRFPQMQDLRYGRFSFNGQNPDIEVRERCAIAINSHHSEAVEDPRESSPGHRGGRGGRNPRNRTEAWTCRGSSCVVRIALQQTGSLTVAF